VIVQLADGRIYLQHSSLMMAVYVSPTEWISLITRLLWKMHFMFKNIIKLWWRLSTVRGLPQHHTHRKTVKKTHVTLIFDLWFLEVIEIHVRTKFHQAKCIGSWVINSALNFGRLQTPDFDREYLWNGSSNRQSENGVMNYDFSTLVKTIWWNLVHLRKMTFIYNLWPWNSIAF